jgi:CRP/FNR family transcriptional regulator
VNKIINFKSHKKSCKVCSLARSCLPQGLDKEALDLLDKLTQQARRIDTGSRLFCSGQPLKSLFSVRTGSIKTMVVTHDGEDRITGFHLPGDVLGLEAFSRHVHSCTAVALEDSIVCELPYKNLYALCQKAPALSRRFMALMSSEIAEKHETMLMLGKKPAELRVAALLLNLSSRFRDRGFPAQQFRLSMSRYDIASYLGLAAETVSRLLGHINDEGIIEVNRKTIKIRDMAHLQKLAQT